MKKYILCLFFVFCLNSTGFASDRIAHEDFEGVTLGSIPQNNPTGNNSIDVAGRPYYGSGGNGAFVTGGNPGKCARAYVSSTYIGGDGYTSPKFQFNNRFNNSKEVYAKFDLRIDPNLTSEFTDFKFISITDHKSCPDDPPWKWYLQVNPSSNAGFSIYSWGGGEYYMSNSTTHKRINCNDGQWHTYIIYIKIGTHITSGSKDDRNNDCTVKVWEDGTLVLEDNHAPVRSVNDHYGINSIGFIRHLFLGSKSGYAGNLYIDNIDVWDGMPEVNFSSPEKDSVPPGIPQKLRLAK